MTNENDEIQCAYFEVYKKLAESQAEIESGMKLGSVDTRWIIRFLPYFTPYIIKFSYNTKVLF